MARRGGAGALAAVAHYDRGMASFSVRFLGCKVSHVDAHAVRERLLADGHEEHDAGADVAVVNTCCVTNEAVAKSRKEAARAARTHCTRLRHRLRCEPRRRRVRRAAGQRRRGRSPQRGDAGLRRGRRRRDRLRPGGHAARPRSRLRQGAGRLLVRVPLLRDPARARRLAEPPGRRRARRDPPPRRSGPPRGRPDRDQPRLLPRPGRGLSPAAARPGGRRDARPRAAPPLVDRDQPRRRRARPCAPRDADREPPPARAAPVGRRRRPARDGPPLLRPHVPAPARAAARRVQPHERRHRRLPDRGRARVREHARRRRGGRADEGARLPLLAAPGHRHGRRGPGGAGR